MKKRILSLVGFFSFGNFYEISGDYQDFCVISNKVLGRS